MLLKSFHEYIIQLVNKGSNYSNEASTILNIVDCMYVQILHISFNSLFFIVNWSSVIYLLITSVSSYLNLLLYSLPFTDSWIHLFIQQMSKCFLMWLIKILMYFSKKFWKFVWSLWLLPMNIYTIKMEMLTCQRGLVTFDFYL